MTEYFRSAIDGIWAHKLRSMLTMLGIIIGIASIIAISSTIMGTNEQIKQNLIGAGNNAVTVKLYKPVNGLKEQAGTLAAYEDGAVTIRQGEKEVRFEKSEVAQVRLRVEF